MIARACAALVALCFYVWLAGCGGSASSTRQLTSITITPATATAPAASGSAQFTASGTFSDGSHRSPLPVSWSIGNPFQTPPIPCCGTVDQNGLAQCNGGAATLPIVAIAPVDPNVPLAEITVTTKTVTGSAQLICQ